MTDARIKVLIAEDEPQLGGLLETFLTGRGFAATLVRDGRRALERLLAEPFDVAILDIVMPELDGLAVLRQLREEPLPPEVIVSSGIGTVDTAIAAIKLGAYDYLPKPYRMTEIEALVRRAHEKRQLVRSEVLRRRYGDCK
ncbi:MAG: response regulator, partial [Gemmatimonadetes bacterium]|nr:response regulator [Gemmatimonadota bacterium]